MLEEVGDDNFFLFGAKSEELTQIRANYNPNKIIAENQALNEVMSLLESGHFNLFEPGLFQPIIDSIRDSNDQWLVAYDFDSYIKAQQQVELAYQDKEYWTRLSILNTAASGGFSSDRTIKQYSQDIWQLDQ